MHIIRNYDHCQTFLLYLSYEQFKLIKNIGFAIFLYIIYIRILFKPIYIFSDENDFPGSPPCY
jgi:hypothetical protein